MTSTTHGKRLAALCSAALLCVTSAALTHDALAATTAATSSAQHTVKTTSKPTGHAKTLTKTNKTKTAAPKQKYKDGTYTGVGQTRIGAVQVAVTLKKDKFTRVVITNHTTHYPIDYINPLLPQELISRQNINKIDVVSGATLSTYDFYFAVKSALQKAERAETAKA